MAEKKRSLRLVGKNEPITTESVVGAPENFEDEFDILLDAESDEEFGVIDFREHNSPGGDRAVLKTWTSQDFSNIYVRFRPHLERYARRWLNNQSQIDEVVQDAFLYLMVTLPDLDSELGVLRFLKWKLRLLCLDVMRASGKAYINNIDDHSDDLAADLPEASAALEAADDAAVVRLALSKLTRVIARFCLPPCTRRSPSPRLPPRCSSARTQPVSSSSAPAPPSRPRWLAMSIPAA